MPGIEYWPRRRRGNVSARRRNRILERDGHTCRECGRHDRLTVDHIIPRAKGGTGELSNLQILCFACNQRKADS